MKVKGLVNKIYRVNPNSILCSKVVFGALKRGEIATLKNDEAEQLIKMGVVEKIKSSKKESK